MNKRLVVAFSLVAVMTLSACGSKGVDDRDVAESLSGLYGSSSFTMDELRDIEEKLFPVSYAYTTYLKSD